MVIGARLIQLGRLWLGMAIVLIGCAAPQPSTPSSRSQEPAKQTTQTPKRITAAIFGDPRNLGTNRTAPGGALGNVPGSDAVEELLLVGLSTIDDKGVLQARMAEAVPSIEAGTWKILGDGRTQTTWRIRDKAVWQDGTAFTSDDLLFTVTVNRDKDVGIFYNSNLDLIESVETPDPRTVTITWTQPFIEADSMFSVLLAQPMPKHLLAAAYAEDRTRLMEAPYWTDEFVGNGAYKLREWVSGSHVAMDASATYVLGKPKIDQLEIRFIYDANALIASILSGAVDLTMGRGLDIEQSLTIKNQRADVEAIYAAGGWVPIYPQFLNTTPAVIGDVRMRRALLHAIDRQELTDSINHGLVEVAHTFVNTNEPVYKQVESSVTRYAHDPRRAGQLIEEIGYVKGADGIYRDAGNQRLGFELWTTAQRDHHIKSIFPVADYWTKLGVAVEPMVVPTQRVSDREYLNSFPAFLLIGMGNGLRSADVKRYHTAFAARPENRFGVAGNIARYMNTEFDALIDRYITTIPLTERGNVLAQIVRQQTDQVTVMGLFYQLRPVIKADRIANVTGGHQTSHPAWNAHEWDLKM